MEGTPFFERACRQTLRDRHDSTALAASWAIRPVQPIKLLKHSLPLPSVRSQRIPTMKIHLAALLLATLCCAVLGQSPAAWAEDREQPLITFAAPRPLSPPVNPQPIPRSVTEQASPAREVLPAPGNSRPTMSNQPRGILAPLFSRFNNRQNPLPIQPQTVQPRTTAPETTPAQPSRQQNIVRQQTPAARSAGASEASEPPTEGPRVARSTRFDAAESMPSVLVSNHPSEPEIESPEAIGSSEVDASQLITVAPRGGSDVPAISKPVRADLPQTIVSATIDDVPAETLEVNEVADAQEVPAPQPVAVRPNAEPLTDRSAAPDRRVLTIDRNDPILTPAVPRDQPPAIRLSPEPEPQRVVDTSSTILHPENGQIAASPELVVRIDAPSRLLHGDSSTINVYITNRGEAVARDVVLDVVGNDQLLKVMPVGAVPAGRTLEIGIQLTPQVLGELELQAVAKARQGSRAVAVRSVLVGEPDLTLAIAGPAKINANQVQNYTAIIDNQGTADATDVSLLVMLQGSETQTLQLGTVLAGQRRRLAFQLRPEQAGALALNAVATAAGGTQAVANGSLSVLAQSIQLTLEGPSEMQIGSAARYRLFVTNTGDADLSEVAVNVNFGESVLESLFRDALPAGETRQVMFEVSPAQAGDHALLASAVAASGAKAEALAHLQVQAAPQESATNDAAVDVSTESSDALPITPSPSAELPIEQAAAPTESPWR